MKKILEKETKIHKKKSRNEKVFSAGFSIGSTELKKLIGKKVVVQVYTK